jgi:hypothetical protein
MVRAELLVASSSAVMSQVSAIACIRKGTERTGMPVTDDWLTFLVRGSWMSQRKYFFLPLDDLQRSLVIF